MNGKNSASFLLRMPLIVASVFLAGCACAGSLRPIHSPETRTEVPQIEGTWLSKGESDTPITVSRTGEKAYQLRWKEKDKEAELVFDLSFLEIDNQLFFDAAFKHVETKSERETAYDLGVVPIHFLGRIWVEEKSMRIRLLEYNWLQQKVKDGQVNLAYVEHHETDEDLILFTANPEDMQAFLRQHADDEGAFSQIATFERVEPESPADDKPET